MDQTAIMINTFVSHAAEATLKEVAIEYHARTEIDPTCANAELQFAYLKMSKYGIDGVTVRKAIAAAAGSKAIEKRIKEIKKVTDPTEKGEFLHERNTQATTGKATIEILHMLSISFVDGITRVLVRVHDNIEKYLDGKRK